MKKFSVIFAIVTAIVLLGCASGGGSKGAADNAEPFFVDLSTLKAVEIAAGDNAGAPTGETVRNKAPFASKYDNLLILFEPPVDVTNYTRVTINCKYFDANNEEIPSGWEKAMVSLIVETSGDIRNENRPNVALKEFNVGINGDVSRDRGVRFKKGEKPLEAILFQNCDTDVKYIEVTEVIFHNGNLDR